MYHDKWLIGLVKLHHRDIRHIVKMYFKHKVSIPTAYIHHIDGWAQDCSNSSALAMELLQSCAKPSMYDI